ncbi:hypothetical protein H1164_07885 [Thermoactinomyces daqus]|jgi:hypothetical protein|uniref:Lipoprotein n=1 Tax=Thermoactinomyces daqus TaxID=1329516 RepID=A0A7W2AI23_9BACL|nr:MULTISPECIES: hypothetical protein [Thermoactinomyces]MBA4542820.1 hypothetical protein [Thermoactinomyces daqus]MBH8604649.1 hypothetical protein [Thermoactinomyces sp. CICC 10522]
MNKVLMFFVIFGLFLTGCSDHLEGNKAPSPVIKINDQPVKYREQTICWDTPCNDIDLNKIKVTQQTTAKPGDPLTIVFDQSPQPSTINLISRKDRKITKLKPEDTFRLPREHGDYIYDLFVFWNDSNGRTDGQAVYSFLIKIH